MRILVVDDEDIQRITVRDDLKEAGHEVLEASNAEDALEMLGDNEVGLVVTDNQMPGMDGMAFMSKMKKLDPAPYVVLVTGYGTVETAVKAIREGAYDYLTKPFSTEELLLVIGRIEELIRLKGENVSLRARLKEDRDRAVIAGRSPLAQKLREQVSLLAQTDSPVLIMGETGTGKDLVARLLHNQGPRSHEPFVKVSCAVYSANVLESELFGYEKGAFTGAGQARAGRFESAGQGTVYLDEVDDIPLELQVKLLHVLEDGVIERMGGARPIPFKARFGAASKVDLKKLADQGKFRQDLFYRLNVHTLNLPTLREYREDIPYLIAHFLFSFGQPADALKISEQAMEMMMQYSWPGNVRELRNLVEGLLIHSKGREITPADLPFAQAAELEDQTAAEPMPDPELGLRDQMDRFEKGVLEDALGRSGNNQVKAAKLLKMKPSTVRDRMVKHGLISNK